ncbi:MAG: ComEC/Rec2 family competence protein [Deltaproteobacteria bacterium]|jgi:ComEC/Rec2-related protein|nr:ComEC/Rec2 family competence protein [Deltaproteobacteria bacterium]
MFAKVVKLFLLIALVLVLEILFLNWQKNSVEQLPQGELKIIGEVLEKSWDVNQNLVLVLSSARGKLRLTVPDIPWENCSQLRVGDTLIVKGNIKFLSHTQQLGSFEKYLIHHGFSGYGSTKGKLNCQQENQPLSGKVALVQKLKQRFAKDYQESLAILLVTLLGEKSGVGDELKTLFRETSTSHLLVISGLHVCIVFYGVYKIAKSLLAQSLLILNHLTVVIPALVISELVTAFYIIISGWTIPSLRAFIAITIFACSELAVFPISKINALLVAILLILLFFPLSILDISFQLSFAAVIGIYVGSQLNKNAKAEALAVGSLRVLAKLRTAFWISFFAWLFTLPVCLYWFNSIVLLGPIINFFFVTVFILCVVYAGGACLILYYLNFPLIDLLLEIVLKLIDYLLELLEITRNLLESVGLGYYKLDGDILWIGHILSIIVCCLACLTLVSGCPISKVIGHPDIIRNLKLKDQNKMKKTILTLITLAVPLSLANADGQNNNVGSCGWGSKLFAGQRGIAPQVFAATTNGTSGNQTFAITSGTSGCTQDGLVTSNWKATAFIEANKTQFARDVARGSGDTIASLGKILNIKDEDQELFVKILKDNFGKIFANADVSTEDIVLALQNVLSENEVFIQ